MLSSVAKIAVLVKGAVWVAQIPHQMPPFQTNFVQVHARANT